MEITLSEKGDALIVLLQGEIDHHVSERIIEGIDFAMEKQDVKNLVFDFTDVTFMDSSGIGILLGRYNKVHNDGGKIIITNAGKYVKRILEMAGVFSLMEYKEKEK